MVRHSVRLKPVNDSVSPQEDRFLAVDKLLRRLWPDGLFRRIARPWPSFFIQVILLAWPSVWFFAKIPVLWNYMDGFLQVSTKPSAANLLVWPPLYCFGARFPMLIGYLIGGGT